MEKATHLAIFAWQYSQSRLISPPFTAHLDKTRLSFVIEQLRNTVLNESLFYNQSKVKPLAALTNS